MLNMLYMACAATNDQNVNSISVEEAPSGRSDSASPSEDASRRRQEDSRGQTDRGNSRSHGREEGTYRQNNMGSGGTQGDAHITDRQDDVYSQNNRTEGRGEDVGRKVDQGVTDRQEDMYRQSGRGTPGQQEGSGRRRGAESYQQSTGVADRQGNLQSDERDENIDSSVSFPGEAPVFQHGKHLAS